jgi:hypothetical protein
MGDEETQESKPSMEEIFGGKDMSIGRELVEKLKFEEVGLPVYYRDPNVEKTEYGVDQQPGDRDLKVRKRDEKPHLLQGIIIPSTNENEYIYFGIHEEGFAFKQGKATHVGIFDSRGMTSFPNMFTRFSEYATIHLDVTLREDDNPQEFNQVITSAIETQREEVRKRKAARAESRSNLKQALYGSEE